MRRPNRVWILAGGMAVFLAGCAQDSAPREEEPIPVEESVFGDQVKALKRAEDTARDMEGRMQDLNKELKEAEGAPSDDPSP